MMGNERNLIMAEITRKLQGITRYETMEYDSKTKILDIHKASD